MSLRSKSVPVPVPVAAMSIVAAGTFGLLIAAGWEAAGRPAFERFSILIVLSLLALLALAIYLAGLARERARQARAAHGTAEFETRQRADAERALVQSEEQYRLVFEANPQPMWIYQPDSLAFLAVNDAALKHYGYTRDEFLSMTLRAVQPDADPLPAEDAPSAPGVLERSPCHHVLKNGAVIDVELTRNAIRFDNRPAFLVLAADATERNRLEEQFRQAQRLESVGRLAGGVAHDFNNLLTVINGYSDILLTSISADGPLQEGLLEIRTAGERAASLTRQLLAFSRKQVIQPVVVNLNDLVADLQKMVCRLIGEHIELVIRTAPAACNVLADPGQLQQVLVNLAVNARDAMPDGGVLAIETQSTVIDEEFAVRHLEVRSGRYVTLSVADTGTGMTPEVQQRLFEPFFTTKPDGKGTGLGLASVYGVVKQCGGWIHVYTAVDRGSTFRILLPQTDEPLPATQSAPDVFLRGSETILLVEDQEEVRQLALAMLRNSGYTVYEAADGMEAMVCCLTMERPLDLLVTDVVMPGISGYELARVAREFRPRLKVLYTSGYSDIEIARQALAEGPAAYLQKPFTQATLCRQVREILSPRERVPAR